MHSIYYLITASIRWMKCWWNWRRKNHLIQRSTIFQVFCFLRLLNALLGIQSECFPERSSSSDQFSSHTCQVIKFNSWLIAGVVFWKVMDGSRTRTLAIDQPPEPNSQDWIYRTGPPSTSWTHVTLFILIQSPSTICCSLILSTRMMFFTQPNLENFLNLGPVSHHQEKVLMFQEFSLLVWRLKGKLSVFLFFFKALHKA